MTDAATLTTGPATRAPAAGSRAAAARPADPAETGAADPFAAVLQGFLGAALGTPAASSPPPAPGAAGTGPGPGGAAPPDPGLPAGQPLPAAAGKALPAATAAATPLAGDAVAGPQATEAAAADRLADLVRGRPAPALPPGNAADRADAAELLATATTVVPDGAAAAASAPDGGLAAMLAELAAAGPGGPQPGGSSTGPAAPAAAPTGSSLLRGDQALAGSFTGGTLAPLGDAASFASGLGERLLDLGRDGAQSARLRLHPETLGPLDVRVLVEDGEARVWFSTAHGQTRDAIEASLPRLRELFASQGLELGRVQVDVRSDGGQPPLPDPAPGDRGAGSRPSPRDVAADDAPRRGSGRDPLAGLPTIGRAGSRRVDVLA